MRRTMTSGAVWSQVISGLAGAEVGARCVDADLVTPRNVISTLIDVWRRVQALANHDSTACI